MVVFVGLCLGLVAVIATAAHHETEALIELDKKWGSAQGADAAGVLDGIIADDVLAVSGEGLGSKAAMLEEAASEDAPAGPYIAGDYKVRFLDDDTAVMVHSAGEPDPHWSLHVWEKRDGKWQVVATISTPIEE
jgi:hypothetical protein